MSGTVAVVTTCFNQADYIEQAIQSVAEQDTTAKVLHVVVDDGSSDGSLAILRDYEERFAHLRVLSITNRGMAGAFNAGLMALPDEVEYVVIIAGDDWLETNFVEECLSALTPDTHMVCTGMRRVTEPGVGGYKARGIRRDEIPKVRNPTVDQLWEWEMTYAWGCALFRREVLIEAGGFHPHVGGDCDWDLWIDLHVRGYQLAYAENTRFYYLFNPGSMNRSKTAAEWDAARLEMRRHHRRTDGPLPGPEFS